MTTKPTTEPTTEPTLGAHLDEVADAAEELTRIVEGFLAAPQLPMR